MYKIPDKYFFRLHHNRPKFKNNFEEILLHVVDSLFEIGELPVKEFNALLNSKLRDFPGNAFRKEKTMDNWRTEIASLFSFIREKDGVLYPGLAAERLSIKRDFGLFWNYFLFSFQYSGGHIANYNIANSIQNKVHFKPCPYLLMVLIEGEKLAKKPFHITPEEATFCVFNDLRVIRDKRTPKASAQIILNNRKQKKLYSYEYELLKKKDGENRTNSDNTRYAKDVLDYMKYARLIKGEFNRLYLDRNNENAINYHIENAEVTFDGYKNLMDSDFGLKDINRLEEDWHTYVNSFDNISEFDTKLDEESLTSVTKAIQEIFKNYKGKSIPNKIKGDAGEQLVYVHECLRTKEESKRQHLILKIPTHLGVGYDLQSIEIPKCKRYIEVKTTESYYSLKNSSVNVTVNEWDSAETLGGLYFIYFLKLNRTGEKKKLFVIQNPIKQIKNGNLKASKPRNNHILIKLNEKAGTWINLLEI